MTETHDYLEDSVRDIDSDLRRAVKKATTVHNQINPVSEFGSHMKLEMFSISETLTETQRRLEEIRKRIREDRMARKG